ncbi:GAF domain-containing protein [Actinomadura rubrisoli]|uniref:GAF domain-containing protein n=1 Tax=Actinomadura rubrisoli TaxID=2530368 RepID=A0A4R5BPK8_9ACTN|nr:GAF domain-containing protein [Actinomadura rubrisoli]TDD88841.1 hypothetical protein E1298_14665 [Actinomadura rubrisoli]
MDPVEEIRDDEMTEDEVPTITWRPAGPQRAAEDRHRLDASLEVMAAVLNGTGLTEALVLVATRARSLARASLAFVALPAEDTSTLRIDIAVGAEGDRIRGLTVRRGRSMIGRAFSSRRALSSRIAVDQALSELPAGPILLLPLETGEAVRGVLAVVGRPGAAPFTTATARELLLFADMSARLIELSEERRATDPGLPSFNAPEGPALRVLRPQRSAET